jgi:hypothetical protein
MAMPLVPYKRVSISTSLSIDRAASVLAGHLVTPKFSKWRFFPRRHGSLDPRKFTGKRYENGFRIWRNVWSKGSVSLPNCYVTFKQAHHGTLVDTVTTLHPLAGVSVLVMMCSVGWYVCRYFTVLISTGVFDSGLVATSSFLLIIYSITMLAFNYEADLTERFLSGIYHEHSVRA